MNPKNGYLKYWQTSQQQKTILPWSLTFVKKKDQQKGWSFL
jgi:hypothetical protein